MKTDVKETEQAVIDEYRKEWASEKMQDFCINKVLYAFRLDDGSYVHIDKEPLETSFCFGYGYCGIPTEDDREMASDNAVMAKTNENYFIHENTKYYSEPLEKVNEALENYDVREQFSYIPLALSNRSVANFKSIELSDRFLFWNSQYSELQEKSKRREFEVTKNDLEKYKTGLEYCLDYQTKRCQRYLKRYGLSKIKAWTYLSD